MSYKAVKDSTKVADAKLKTLREVVYMRRAEMSQEWEVGEVMSFLRECGEPGRRAVDLIESLNNEASASMVEIENLRQDLEQLRVGRQVQEKFKGDLKEMAGEPWETITLLRTIDPEWLEPCPAVWERVQRAADLLEEQERVIKLLEEELQAWNRGLINVRTSRLEELAKANVARHTLPGEEKS